MDKLLEYKRSWIQHVNRMPRNRLPRVMKHYCPTGRRNHGRPLKSLLDTRRPERVNKWPNSMKDIWWWWWWWWWWWMMLYSTLEFIVIILLAGAWSKCTAKLSVFSATRNSSWIRVGMEISLVFGLAVHINTIWLCVLSVKLQQSTRPQKRCACLYGDRLVNNLRNVTAHLHMHSRTEGQTDKSPLWMGLIDLLSALTQSSHVTPFIAGRMGKVVCATLSKISCLQMLSDVNHSNGC